MALVGFRHVGLKIVSIALAALLWLVVAGEQIVERALRIPLEFTNLPSELELAGEPPTSVDVRVRGSSGALSRIAPGELVAVLDVRSARPGQRLFHVTGAEVRAPFGVEVVQVSPSSVYIAFEASASKVVPIVPELEGEPAEGFVVGTVTADPATVEVVGSASAIAELTEAVTEPLSVKGAAGPVSDVVTVGVTDPSLRLRAPQTARVRVNITAAPLEWVVAGVRVNARNGQARIAIVPAEVTVHVRGPGGASRYAAGDFDASVDVRGLARGQYDLPVRVAPPERLGVVRIEPAEVRVRIR